MDAQLLAAPSDCLITSNKKLTCTVNRLPAGSSVSWSFTVLPATVNELLDTASVKFNKPDSNPGDNSFSLSTPIVSASPNPNSGTSFSTPASKPGNAPIDLNGPMAANGKTRIYPIMANAVRECDPVSQPDDLKAVATGHNKLAFDRYTALNRYAYDDNLFLSTNDTLQILAMLTAGAGGYTLNAALADMRTGLDEKRLHRAMNAAALDMANRNQAAHLKQGFALWGQGRSKTRKDLSYQFATPFLNKLVRNYGAKMAKADFTDTQALEQSIPNSINDWVSANTNTAISELLDEFPERTRLVAASTTSLHGSWQIKPSQPAGDKRFELPDGRHILTPMLSFSGELPYTEGDGYRAFELPLANNDLALAVLMPEHGRFGEFQSGLTSESLNNLIAAMKPRSLTINLPKFKLDFAASLDELAPNLADAGAFIDGWANFSRVNGLGFIFLDSGISKSTLALDKNGVQANAAQQVVLRAYENEPDSAWGGSSGSVWVGGIWSGVVNACNLIPHWEPALAQARPFIFALRDRVSGTILFMGQLTTVDGQPAPPDSTGSCPVP